MQPRARRDELAGLRENVLLVRISAPAVEGRANRALCRLLAKHVGVAPTHVSIVRGEHSREKLIEIDGIDQPTLDAAISSGGH